jgi:hypothetical protein
MIFPNENSLNLYSKLIILLSFFFEKKNENNIFLLF